MRTLTVGLALASLALAACDDGSTFVPTNDTDTDTDSDTDPPDDGVLLISEVVDHSEYAFIKYVEIFNGGSTQVSLGGWSVISYANGGTTGRTADLPDVGLGPGEVFVLANAGQGIEQFETWYGRSADAYDGAITGNGNDAYVLVRGSEIRDVYGVIGEDGTGTGWEYTDSVARRAGAVREPSTSWRRSEWEITFGHLQSTPFLR